MPTLIALGQTPRKGGPSETHGPRRTIRSRRAQGPLEVHEPGSLVSSTVAALFGVTTVEGSTALASPGTILFVQLLVLALGVAGSAYTVRRITRSQQHDPFPRRATGVPYLVLVGIIAVLHTYMFTLPMAHRM